jgi:arginyl-tRNA synthetase
MSGRKGRGVKADDLIDRLEAAALERMASAELSGRTPLSADEQREAARLIAIGALRYFLLKYSRNSVIAFDFREALALEGETGPYLQYTRARLNSLFAKLAAAGFDPDESLQDMEAQRLTEMLAAAEGADLWETVLLAAQLPEVLRRACDTLEPAVLAKYAFQVAQAFNNLYQRHPIIKEPDAGRRRLLVGVCRLIHRTLGDAMDVLGIPTPFRM